MAAGMASLPFPAAAWPLDGSPAATHGGFAVILHGSCEPAFTTATENASQALRVSSRCFAAVPDAPSLAVGTGSFTACAQFRTRAPGAPLLSKLGAAGFAVEVAESGHGLGISLADNVLGTSVHEDLGHLPLADGQWHHACVVLQRWGSAQLAVYLDGREAERLHLEGSRLARLGSIDTDVSLLLGRRFLPSADEVAGAAGAPSVDALRNVGIWSRALLPEHVAALARYGLPAPRARRHAHHSVQHYGGRGGGSGGRAAAATGRATRTLPMADLPHSAWAGRSAALVLLAVAVGCCVRRHRRRAHSAWWTRLVRSHDRTISDQA